MVIVHQGTIYSQKTLCYQMYKHYDEEETTEENTFKCLNPLVAFMTLKKGGQQKNKTGSQE